MNERMILEVGDAVQAIRDAKWRNRTKWEDVENLSGVKYHTISHWNDKTGPQLRILLKALDALGLEMVIRPKDEGGRTDDS